MLKSNFKRLFADRRGNFAIMAAILMTPVFGCVGLAVDYARAMDLKTQLQAAADAAALGAIAEGSPGVKIGLDKIEDGRMTLAETDASNLFRGYLIGSNGVELGDVKTEVVKTGTELRARIDFSASIETTFARIFGYDDLTVSGAATAVVRTAPYMDFYMLLDNSPSMGVGATLEDIQTMVKNTPDKCAFACHDLSTTNNYYNLAKELGVAMRIDVVRQATQRLMDKATAMRKFKNQFRVAAYTFGEAATDMRLTEISKLTKKLEDVKAAAAEIDLMTIPKQNYNNDQQTDFDTTFADLNKKIKGKVGDGSKPSRRQKYVFFVSDGVGDSDKPAPHCTKRTTNRRCQEPIDVDVCQQLKDRGIKVAVLYTTYLPLPENNWYNEWIKPFQHEIDDRMEDCASPGLFFEVSPSEGIAEAMEALFIKVISSPRLVS